MGRGGIELGDWWDRDGYRSYEGITVPGFPNLFNLHSPFAFSGLCYFNTIEAAMSRMSRCLREMRRRNAGSFEVTEGGRDGYMATMRARATDTIFSVGSCATTNSYYFNQHGETTLVRLSSARRVLHSSRHFPLESYVFLPAADRAA